MVRKLITLNCNIYWIITGNLKIYIIEAIFKYILFENLPSDFKKKYIEYARQLDLICNFCAKDKRFPDSERSNHICKNIKGKSKNYIDKQQEEVESALERVSLRARRRIIHSQDEKFKQESSKGKKAEINTCG